MFPAPSLAKTDDEKGRLNKLTVRPELVGAMTIEGSQMSVKFNSTGSMAAGALGPLARTKAEAVTSKVRSIVAACALAVIAARATLAIKA
jgi:hypothetical protein